MYYKIVQRVSSKGFWQTNIYQMLRILPGGRVLGANYVAMCEQALAFCTLNAVLNKCTKQSYSSEYSCNLGFLPLFLVFMPKHKIMSRILHAIYNKYNTVHRLPKSVMRHYIADFGNIMIFLLFCVADIVNNKGN